MLVDANILLFAVDSSSPFHLAASTWLAASLNAPQRVALPWQSLIAFMRIATHPRVFDDPLTGVEATSHIDSWLGRPNVWIPAPTTRHAEVLATLISHYDLRGNLVSDAHLAALAIEHGLTVCSADTDFARFREIRWTNPV